MAESPRTESRPVPPLFTLPNELLSTIIKLSVTEGQEGDVLDKPLSFLCLVSKRFRDLSEMILYRNYYGSNLYNIHLFARTLRGRPDLATRAKSIRLHEWGQELYIAETLESRNWRHCLSEPGSERKDRR